MATWIIGSVLFVALALATRSAVRSMRSGKCSGCSGGCHGCGSVNNGNCACHASAASSTMLQK